eukprot:SAG22_NODE_1222_length_5126_cov_3.213248_5_plen_234_part_00
MHCIIRECQWGRRSACVNTVTCTAPGPGRRGGTVPGRPGSPALDPRTPLGHGLPRRSPAVPVAPGLANIAAAAALSLAALLLLAGAEPAAAAAAPPWKTISLSLRNGSETSTVTWDPRETAMLIIDPWSYHWCKTFTNRATSQHRLFNAATAAGRKAGMTVIWSPTDAEESYIGWPQYERAHNIPRQPPVNVRNSSIPSGDAMTPFRSEFVASHFSGLSLPLELAAGAACEHD